MSDNQPNGSTSMVCETCRAVRSVILIFIVQMFMFN